MEQEIRADILKSLDELEAIVLEMQGIHDVGPENLTETSVDRLSHLAREAQENTHVVNALIVRFKNAPDFDDSPVKQHIESIENLVSELNKQVHKVSSEIDQLSKGNH